MDEKRLEIILKENEKHLEEFEKWLINQKLANKTIERHIANIDNYINEFLCYTCVYDIVEGMDRVSTFLDDWYPRRAYIRKDGVNSYCTSIKKFYKCMCELGYVDIEDYEDLCFYMKEEKELWIEVAETLNK